MLFQNQNLIYIIDSSKICKKLSPITTFVNWKWKTSNFYLYHYRVDVEIK